VPKDFDDCVKNGGRVRTITGGTPGGKKLGLKPGQYCHVCFDNKGMHIGHRKQRNK
jgi:hypothetical protein